MEVSDCIKYPYSTNAKISNPIQFIEVQFSVLHWRKVQFSEESVFYFWRLKGEFDITWLHSTVMPFKEIFFYISMYLKVIVT